MSRKKLTLEYVKDYIEVKSQGGYILLSKVYENNYSDLEIQCKEGHIFHMPYKNFQCGHDLVVKHGVLTIAEFKEKELKRNYHLMRKGWKSIRIISQKDAIPSDEKLIEMLEYGKQYLSTGKHYIKFDIDNSIIITSQYISPYNFGILRMIRAEVA